MSVTSTTSDSAPRKGKRQSSERESLEAAPTAKRTCAATTAETAPTTPTKADLLLPSDTSSSAAPSLTSMDSDWDGYQNLSDKKRLQMAQLMQYQSQWQTLRVQMEVCERQLTQCESQRQTLRVQMEACERQRQDAIRALVKTWVSQLPQQQLSSQ